MSTVTQPGANAGSSPEQQSNDVAANPQDVLTISLVGSQSHSEDPERSPTRTPHCDTEMLDATYSYFSDDGDETDEDVDAQPPKPQHRASRQTKLARQGDVAHTSRVKAVNFPRKKSWHSHSNSALRETHLRQQVVHLKSQARASKRELEEKNAKILEKDAEILHLVKSVKLLEIKGNPITPHHDNLAVVRPKESSPMDDIIYQDIVHQRRNDKIIQEAKAAKQKAFTQKAASELSFGGTATDDEKENASQKGTASRRTSQILPSNGAIPLGHALRFTGASSGNYAQRPKSANSNKAEKSSETPTPAQGPIRRAGRLVRQISDTLLGRHRESIPPVPILRQWKEVHNDIQKRYTGDSGYESIDLSHVENCDDPDEDLDRASNFHGNDT
jgi:hypothetical protein